jgi:DNA polymerase-1
MLLDEVTVLDFETHAIQARPAPIPEPVGLAIRWPNGVKEYLSWGHPTWLHSHNNSTKGEAFNALVKAFRGPVVFHNARFDLEVAWTHFGLQYPRDWHDTMFLAFLDCPHAPSFALKATAERLLNLPHAAQDVLHEWILANVPEATSKTAGAFIAQAPVNLVAPYAIQDVDFTFRLFKHLYPKVALDMSAAYDRERRLMPWLLDAEVRGVRVDRELLAKWNALFLRGIPIVESQLCRRLNVTGLNFDADREVAMAIDRAGLVPVWELTASGQYATNKKAMARQCADKEFLNLLSLRNTASTMHKFVQQWEAASTTDGRLHTQWNQTRSIDNTGTKTGRVGSEKPNLANVPNASLNHPELPNLRRAFLPEEGHTWLKADFSQQEFRIAAHFENGAIMWAYQQNANIDFHELTSQLVQMNTSLVLPRKQIKNVNFCLLYGGGVPRLMEVLGVTSDEAAAVRSAYYTALPGMHRLSQLVQMRSISVGGVRTIGGRFMPVEPPNLVKGQTYEYKQLNKLVQGSAADMTKEAIIKFGDAGTPARLLITVYDEIDVSVPSIMAIGIAGVLDTCMCKAIPIDVPVCTDLSQGSNWGELEGFNL